MTHPCTCGRRIIGGSQIARYICCGPSPLRYLERETRAKSRTPTPASIAELERSEPRPPGMTTALYRRYDADQILLYVGVTDWLRNRASMHGSSMWVEFADSGTTEWFADRKAAEWAEYLVITTELPLFNRFHSTPGARERLMEYLTAKGRPDLVAAVQPWRWDLPSQGNPKTGIARYGPTGMPERR